MTSDVVHVLARGDWKTINVTLYMFCDPHISQDAYNKINGSHIAYSNDYNCPGG